MKKGSIKFLSALVFLMMSVLFLYPSEVITTKNKQYRVPQVNSKVKADGILDEAVWEEALALELNYEVQPGENIKPPVRTEVLLAYDRTHFYAAFRAYDPVPAKIRARYTDRDDYHNQDWVELVLDTFNDERRSYGFLCNPLGVQSDFVETPDGGDIGWDAIWDAGGRINREGYVVEMSIPFRSLRFQREEGDQVWGFDAVRFYPRNVSHEIGLFPRDRNNNCYLCQAVKLIGFKGGKPSKNLEFDPTLVGHTAQEREDGTGGPFVSDKGVEAGITARWGFTPNLTLSAAVNPDFSQVEADALQMDINEPFALFYPEKRPFFTEGSDFFNTWLNVVYTRTMRDPSWGVKLTGKEGSNTIGAYMVRDTLTNLVFPGSQSSSSTSLSMDSTAVVLRYRRDFGSRYRVGALFTGRQGEDYFNRVYGVDGDFRFSSADRVTFLALGSSSRYPDEAAATFNQPQGTFNDKALDILYAHDTRNLDFSAGYRDIGKDFRADLGFIPRVGYRSYSASAQYYWYAKPNKWWTRFILAGNYTHMRDSDNNLLIDDIWVDLTYTGPLEIHSFIQFNRRNEVYNLVKFPINRFLLHHCMNPIGRMHTGLNVWWGDGIDYANARPGKSLRLRYSLYYDIGLHLKLTLIHTFERMRVNSERLYTANLSELHLTYQFNKRMFVRTILQYVDYRYNTANYTFSLDPEYRHLFTQILFSYKINPQTVLFLGYTDNYEGYENTGLPQVDRKLFLKIGYALVM